VPLHAWKVLKFLTIATVAMTSGALLWEWYEHAACITVRQRVVFTTMVRALAAEEGEPGMEVWRRVAAEHPGLVENIALMSRGQAAEAIDFLTDELAVRKMKKRLNRRTDEN
jgi:hypothetical protein